MSRWSGSSETYGNIEGPLSRFLEQLRLRYGHELESVIHFSPPFAKLHYVLVVLAASRVDVWDAYQVAGPDLLRKIDLICLRADDLYQLALPAPNPTLMNLPYSIRETGTVIWGRDVRHDIPLQSGAGRFLACHLDRVRCSRHDIILFLMNKQYDELLAHLRRERVTLMYAALLERDILLVSYSSMQCQFLDSYPDVELKRNIAEFRNLRGKMRWANKDQSRRLAYKGAWLFEMFVRALGRYAQ